MVSIGSLLVPIVVSAVLVFVVSAIIHMVLPYHNSDLRRLRQEDEVMDALRRFSIPPGDYMTPCGGSPAAMRDPVFIDKMKRGPVVIMTVMQPGPPTMTKELAMWFGYSILVGIFAAYMAGRALAPGADYLSVFRFAGTTAFLSYSFALLQDSIWFHRNWRMTMLSMFDGLVYGLLTAGTFGWLWPR
jgi:hypothetical protein